MQLLGHDPFQENIYPKEIDYQKVITSASKYADIFRGRKDQLIAVLTGYETHHVAHDEIERSIDLLQHLEENKQYFVERVNTIVSFLPINQPLYALTCFGIVPSLMAQRVFVRPPIIASNVFNSLANIISLSTFVPNLRISNDSRKAFILEHSKGKKIERADVVIFTGKTENAASIQPIFGRNVLFIGNGASHNPIVISKTAEINKAVEAVLEVQLYNQGGDCAAPNAILVEEPVYNIFLNKLHKDLKKVHVGAYADPKVFVGPLSERKHLSEIEEFLYRHKEWIDPETPGIIRIKDNILEPTIITKPLATGGNYNELYAPVFVIQKYENDDTLAAYFENAAYAPHAGYVTLFGESQYVDQLISKSHRNGKILHDGSTIVKNTHLHAYGVERGTKPYGGYGSGSSFIAYKGYKETKPTLPQRDIFENLILPRKHSF
ncbi:MAG: Lysyl-tRNA synthetase (Class I) [Candidatus Woesebacteria bacterium GW2011_GWB1_41_10]|uniref:Lysyl-tRNA synthetase (Class I) n=2 Tax=Microgenomates group TaxID=1794810 RepID=A0A0G0R9C0_9BACT|nr:MAG: Lysyl-tRNA synthetase (Class I) [Candidatus Curtissbacteria bacterium GW2011_GWA1_40_16]KKR86239.1 MAG: Lysyl-tRNA synthetase (Class I) [Candidatus Woesebacteria bacterium GW2011_GWB1_41_10]